MNNLERLSLKKFKLKNISPDATILLYGRRRSGKCMGKNTKILMFDGSVKNIQDIKVDELVMGDDSVCRKVLGVNNGIDKLYKVTNKNGDSYIVNSEHVLSLKNINENKYVDIPIEKYMLLSIKCKNELHGYQVSVNFEHKELELDPYIIGLCLGRNVNLTYNSVYIGKIDINVVKYLKNNLKQYNCYLNNNNDEYSICWGDDLNFSNFSNTLHKYIFSYNKYIPDIYKCNSRLQRLELLAGILDSDNNYDTLYECSKTLKNEKMIDDAIYLAKSLGIPCYKKFGKEWCINIFKDSKIPIKKIRESISNNISNSNASLEFPIIIEELPKDEYYGFELDGNHRFVLGNFIVTHNSFLARDILYNHKDIPLGIVFSGTEEANPFFGNFIPDTFIHKEYKPELIEGLLVSQSRKVKDARINGFSSTDGKHDGNRTFIILDDMLADSANWKREKTIKEIFLNGRHYNIFFILTMQYPVGIPPDLRSNIDYVFVFNEPSIKNRKSIYDNYAGVIPSFDHFCNILDACTQNHECLVIKTSGNSTDLKDQIFWYKASKHDTFRVGHPKIWKYHDQNYNSIYDEQRDRDQEEMNRLKKKFSRTHKLKVIVSRTGDIVDEKLEEED